MSAQPTLKEINSLKKKLGWGEIPPFFHMVSNSLADLEGIHTHGFDHALKRLVNRQNWNLDKLKGKMNQDGEIAVTHKPEITLYRRFNEDQDYEITCAPISQGGPVLVYAKGDPFIDFRLWDPATMGTILKIPKFSEFIVHAYKKGDTADRLLVHYASNIVDSLLQELSKDIQITEEKGESLKQIIHDIEAKINN